MAIGFPSPAAHSAKIGRCGGLDTQPLHLQVPLPCSCSRPRSAHTITATARIAVAGSISVTLVVPIMAVARVSIPQARSPVLACAIPSKACQLLKLLQLATAREAGAGVKAAPAKPPSAPRAKGGGAKGQKTIVIVNEAAVSPAELG